MNKNIKLVLSGSGTLYPCFVGSAIRLAEEGYIFNEVCGVSGGSVVAASLCSGYKPNSELIKLIKQTLPSKNKLIDMSVFALFQNWGLIKGDKIEKMLQQYMVKTFADVKIPLSIVTTDVSTQKEHIFSTKLTPGMSVPLAIRASMAIPFVFTPVAYGGEYYVDGGLFSNFLWAVFGDGENTIGVRFGGSQNQFHPTRSIKDYIMNLIDTSISANMDRDLTEAEKARCINIVSKYGHLDFNILDADVDKMVQEGWIAADNFIKSGKGI